MKHTPLAARLWLYVTAGAGAEGVNATMRGVCLRLRRVALFTLIYGEGAGIDAQ